MVKRRKMSKQQISDERLNEVSGGKKNDWARDFARDRTNSLWYYGGPREQSSTTSNPNTTTSGHKKIKWPPDVDVF